MQRLSALLLAHLLVLSVVGCGDNDRRPVGDGGTGLPDATPDAGPEELTLKTGAPVMVATVYEGETFRNPGDRTDSRDWIPSDVTRGPDGTLWIVQQAERGPGGFDDVTECTSRGSMSASTTDDDCIALIGSTVTITDPANPEPASEANGRSILISDANAWHFMRRPSAIAFGMPSTTIMPGDPGALAPDGTSLISEPVTYMNPFATCHDTISGNFTDESPFAGPSLWTADPALYNGRNGTESWSNGSHLDMVHATQYCTGIAWERDNVYWAVNGAADTYDRYDFGAPHLSGHFYHEDAIITRYQWDAEGPVRVPDVPSNVMINSGTLYTADSGNGRVIALPIDATGMDYGTFRSFEGIEATRIGEAPLSTIIDESGLAAEWGGAVVPSGLDLLDDETLVVANNATGHISLIGLDGTVIRTIDTGVGAGIGGLTVLDGTIYFVQMAERRLHRIDVEEGVLPGE